MTRRGLALLGLMLAVLGGAPARGHAQTARVWEVNGVRLEASQVERLASDIARQTVVADAATTALEPASAGSIGGAAFGRAATPARRTDGEGRVEKYPMRVPVRLPGRACMSAANSCILWTRPPR